MKEKPNLRLAIARAGNVVGGGDWTPNRLIPDCVKNWGQKIKNHLLEIRTQQDPGSMF